MALTDKQISGLLDEVVGEMRPLKRDLEGNETAKILVKHLERWNAILKDNMSMQLLGLTLATTYAEMDKHKETHYVIDKTLQMGMLVGYLLRQKEQEVEQLEKMHEDSPR